MPHRTIILVESRVQTFLRVLFGPEWARAIAPLVAAAEQIVVGAMLVANPQLLMSWIDNMRPEKLILQ
jgi:hypothetical protein